VSQWRGVLEAVIRERRPALVGYACLFARDRAAAEDLVQEALVRTFARRRAIEDVHAAEGYVRQAIRTSFLDATRKETTWRSRSHLFAGEPVTPGPERAASASVDVRAALAGLSPRERACMVLRFFDDLPVAQIAAELGVGEGAVKRYLHDGAAKLRVSLGADVVDDATLTSIPLTIIPARTP
jgi:RNA polymerase sigma factor (sigma-70 family)